MIFFNQGIDYALTVGSIFHILEAAMLVLRVVILNFNTLCVKTGAVYHDVTSFALSMMFKLK